MHWFGRHLPRLHSFGYIGYIDFGYGYQPTRVDRWYVNPVVVVVVVQVGCVPW